MTFKLTTLNCFTFVLFFCCMMMQQSLGRLKWPCAFFKSASCFSISCWSALSQSPSRLCWVSEKERENNCVTVGPAIMTIQLTTVIGFTLVLFFRCMIMWQSLGRLKWPCVFFRSASCFCFSKSCWSALSPSCLCWVSEKVGRENNCVNYDNIPLPPPHDDMSKSCQI